MKEFRPRLLFVTPILHHPPIGGPTLRIENSIKALSQISDMHIYSRVPVEELGGIKGLQFYRQLCTSFIFAPFAFPCNRYVTFLKRCLNKISRSIIGRNSVNPASTKLIEDFGYLLKIADKLKVDIVWLGYGNISYPLLRFIKANSRYKVVIDTDSVWSRYVLRGLPYTDNEEEQNAIERSGKEKEEEERWGTLLSDVTTAVSEVDAEYYRAIAQSPDKVLIFSNVIDLEMYKQDPRAPTGLKKPCIYLAGTFWKGSPMEDAARWVINEVIPVLRQKTNGVNLYIIGTGSDQVLADVADPSITITGQVDSVVPYLKHADVALVPLRFESGTRFKILEAGACGIPVVSTTLGAEGIGITHRNDILIADNPHQFSEAVIELLSDRILAAKMGANLRKLVQAQYSIHKLKHEGRRILSYLLDCKA